MKKQATFLALLTILFLSCTAPNKSSIQPKESISTPTPKLPTPKVDSSAQLAFTSMIRSILQDSKGNYWFGSDLEGVCKYDGESFTYFTIMEGLCHNQVRTIQEDEHGYIWFATGNGICSYDGEKIQQHKTAKLNSFMQAAPSAWKKEANDLWFNGELEGGVYRYDGEKMNLLEFPVLDENHESYSIHGTVTGICEGHNNMVWIANYMGVIGYNGVGFSYINNRQFQYHVRSIYEDSKGTLWIGNNGIGVLCYDGKNTVKLADKETGLIALNGFPNHVFSIAEDKYGNIWIGDRDTGAWRYDGTSLTNYTTANGLSSNFIRVIYQDKKGELWFGLSEGGVCQFNGEAFVEVY